MKPIIRTVLRMTLPALVILMLPTDSYAQGKPKKSDSNPLVFTSHDDPDKKVLSDSSQQVRFNDPKAPRFILTDSKGTFSLGIGANVRTVMEYDFGGIVDNVDFFPSQIAIPGDGNYLKDQFQMDITSSSLFIKLIGKTNRMGNFVVYLNGNFRGSGDSFILHNAYISFMGFTAGYDYGTFTDVAASPATVDYEGPAGQVQYRVTQLRYTRAFLKNLSFGVGIEAPHVNAVTDENIVTNVQQSPDFPAYIQYNWKNNSHFRLAGILRFMSYSSSVDKKAYSEVGWGIQGGTTFGLTQKLRFMGQFTYGNGISHFFNDLGRLNVDLVPDSEELGKMQILSVMGWYTGLRYNFTPDMFISGTYSLARIYSNKDYPATGSDMYRYGQYLAFNGFWDLSTNLRVGVEYLRGWRTDFSGITTAANRSNLLVQYSF